MTTKSFEIKEFEWFPKYRLLVKTGKVLLNFDIITIHGKTRSINFRRCHGDFAKPLSIVEQLGFVTGHHIWSYTANVDGEPMWAVMRAPVDAL